MTRVIICSGHMIDAPGRKEPRFPPAKEARVRERIAARFDEWRVGPGDVAISGGARGADILFSEEAVRRGARGLLLISLPEEEFLDASVRLPGSDWEQRYRALREKCETRFQHEALDRVPSDMSVFARNNLWMIETARQMAADRDIYALLVWDEKPAGDGPGGTSDFARRIAEGGGKVTIINPTLIEA